MTDRQPGHVPRVDWKGAAGVAISAALGVAAAALWFGKPLALVAIPIAMIPAVAAYVAFGQGPGYGA